MTNGVRHGGHVMVPNLGYKKDAFLEPSLISNFLFNTPITNTSTTMSPTRRTNKQACHQPGASTPSPSSSNGSVTWSNSFLRGGIVNLQEYRTPRGEVLSRPNQQLANLMNGTRYPTPSEVWTRSLSFVLGLTILIIDVGGGLSGLKACLLWMH